MGRINASRLALVAALSLCALLAGAAMSDAQPDVLWLGIQERDDLSAAAENALESGIRVGLIEALSPTITLEAVTPQSPSTRRALHELDFLDVTPGDALGDRAARALGLALGAKATIRAWAEVVGDATRLTTFTAAVHRRQAAIHQVRGAAPPAQADALIAWGESVGRRAASAVAGSLGDLLEGAPHDARGFAAAAQKFLDDRAPGIAALEFGRAIAAAPREAAYYVGSARAYRALGDRDRARRQLEIAVGLNPNALQARLELGRIHLLAGEAEVAVGELERAVELGAGNEARMELAAALMQSGDIRAAREQYETVAQSDPDNTQAATSAAQLTAALASPQDLAQLLRAAQTLPESQDIHRKLLDAYAERGDATEAMRHLRSLFEKAGVPVSHEPGQYVRITRLMDSEAEAILNEAQERWQALERAAITPDAMSDALAAMQERSDGLARAAEAIAAPQILERGHRHRALAYSLLSQSDFALLRYLERREEGYYDQAVIARQAAAAELSRAWDLDAEAGWPTRTAAER